MVNFHDPLTFAREFAATINLWHTMDGIFIWEFFTTLDYEWDVIWGHRPYRWTIWVYSLTRFSTLMAITLNLFTFDNRTKVNCQAESTMNVFFAYVAFGSASLLIVLRIIAIWNKQRVVVLIAVGVWLVDVAFLIYGTEQIRSVWSDESNACMLANTESNKMNIIVSLASDVILLFIMLAGLLRLRLQDGDFGLGRILWNQSLIWLLVVTVAEVPPAVFFCLNLNGAMDLMFQGPNMVIMTIASTRMYRSLINSENTGASFEIRGTGRTASSIQFRSRPVPLKQMSKGVLTNE